MLAHGENNHGQLGDGSFDNRATPVALVHPELTNICQVAAGREHTLCLRADGTVWAWGRNHVGQLGDGSQDSSPDPVQVHGIQDAVAIAAGTSFSFAIREDGTLWAWGTGSYGATGLGTSTSFSVPIRVGYAASVIDISAAGNHSLILTARGDVRASGRNDHGQTGGASSNFGKVQLPEPVARIAAGDQHSLALTHSGKIFSWGLNHDPAAPNQNEAGTGQLGIDRPQLKSTALPTRVFGPFFHAVSIAAGGSHSLAIAAGASHHLWGWGRNDHGQVGDGSTANRFYPVALQLAPDVLDSDGDGLPDWVELALGTDPNLRDSNGDGLSDLRSLRLGIDPRNTDHSGNGISNADARFLGLDPFSLDSDGDGVPDHLDPFPLDPTRWSLPHDPEDTTPPIITLLEPAAAQELP